MLKQHSRPCGARRRPIVMKFSVILLLVFCVPSLTAVWNEEGEEFDEEREIDRVEDEETRNHKTATTLDLNLNLYLRLISRLKKINRNKEKVMNFLVDFNETSSYADNRLKLLSWAYSTNTTKVNSIPMNKWKVFYEAWALGKAREAQKFDTSALPEDLKRRIKKIATVAVCKSEHDRKVLAKIKSNMSEIYAKGQVVYNGKNLTAGESGPEHFFKTVFDYDALAIVWKGWRDATGKKLRKSYTKMVNLLNKGAKENNFTDYGYYEWSTDFEDKNFNHHVLELYKKISPLYKELHAYVRYKLSLKYKGRFDPKGKIPAHLLGNVWAQQWHNIYHIVEPYSNVSRPDVTSTMKAQKWTVHKMFKTAEEFFYSIGLYNMTKTFWKKSMFKNPGDRPVQCHASAWDFSHLDDFRIKMCTKVIQNHFTTIHHEMGHITYFMAYKNLPISFRTGANSGFHEAIGDTIALSVSTPKHLKKIGLLKSVEQSPEAKKNANINTLMYMALQKVAFLPFGLLMDIWRWRVFNGTIKSTDYNKAWWDLRHKFNGLEAPVPRSENDFDPGAKYHITMNVPYIRYFASFIMQFQFYEAMCNKSNHVGPLHECDFYQSKPAGTLLKSMLEMGSSENWHNAMKKITGQVHISLSSLNRYFAPLKEWLKEQRRQIKYPIGW